MVSKTTSFENTYEDFSLDIAKCFLNDALNGLSEKFENKLKKYSDLKLQILTTKMEKDLFYNGTVYTGSAGFALYYFMCAIKQGDNHDLLKTALRYIDIDKLKGRSVSFICGDAGPLALATVISYKLGHGRPENLPDYKTLVQRLMTLALSLEQSPDEMLYGKAGYLYSLLFVNKHIPGTHRTIPGAHIQKVISSIMESGKQFSAETKSESPLLWQWHNKIYFGAAHGMSGILYMLLQVRVHIQTDDLNNYIKPTIDWLLNQRFPSGNYPSSAGTGSGDKYIQWCHGAPGFIPLCILAARVFKDDKYMEIASQASDVIWQRGLCTKGYSMCHGVSGNAYAFIQMYQATKHPLYFYRACCFVDWCVKERPGTEQIHPDRPASLFEGLVGRLYLAEDITDITNAKFPAFAI